MDAFSGVTHLTGLGEEKRNDLDWPDRLRLSIEMTGEFVSIIMLARARVSGVLGRGTFCFRTTLRHHSREPEREQEVGCVPKWREKMFDKSFNLDGPSIRTPKVGVCVCDCVE